MMSMNRKVKRFSALFLALIMALSLMACGGERDDAAGENTKGNGKKQLISMGAGSPGGAQQVYVGACAALVSNYANQIELVPETSGSGGCDADLAAMLQGEAELSYVSNASASRLYNSTNPELRSVWGALPQEFIIVTNDKNVNDIADLAGKTIAVNRRK